VSFSPTDFADDTDYERYVLDLLGTHRVRPAEPSATYSIRGKAAGHDVAIQLGAVISGAGAREELRKSLQPLGFGATYKVLDMLVEHVLRANRAPAGRLTFEAKLAHVRSRPSVLPRPLDSRPDLSDRLAALYVGLVDARHAMTHRRASVVGEDVAIYDTARRQTDTLSSAEIMSFAAAVHATAELVIDRSDDTRRLAIVAWHLDQLQPRHGLPVLGVGDPTAAQRVLELDAQPIEDGRLRIDASRVRGTIESQPGQSFWDLRIYDGRGKVFVGRWDDLPDRDDADTFDFVPETLPEWLSEEIPSS
jgi:hypothetical protein